MIITQCDTQKVVSKESKPTSTLFLTFKLCLRLTSRMTLACLILHFFSLRRNHFHILIIYATYFLINLCIWMIKTYYFSTLKFPIIQIYRKITTQNKREIFTQKNKIKKFFFYKFFARKRKGETLKIISNINEEWMIFFV